MGAGLGAGAVAGPAALHAREGQGQLRAGEGLLEGDFRLVLEVGPALGPAPAARRAAAEEVLEEVAEYLVDVDAPGEALEAGRHAAAAAAGPRVDPGLAELVVEPALLLV